MPLQEAHQWDFLCLIEYGLIFIWLLVNQEKTLFTVDYSCVIMLRMSPVQEYGVVSSA